MSPKISDENTNEPDSARSVTKDDNKKTSQSAQGSKGNGGGKQKDKNKPPSTTPSKKSESSTGKQTPGYADGNSVLANYGLGISGRKERILSPFKTDKFFHFVDQAWQTLQQVKPHVHERFSRAEFRHASALQLYARIEAVKFEGLGIKPAAPTRIPLPRNLRVFQPLWSILANIGIVDDDELRVTYIPDGILPSNAEGDSDEDLDNLTNCTLYDWNTSWNQVLKARKERANLQSRTGYTEQTVSNETATYDVQAIKNRIREVRREITRSRTAEDSGEYRIVDGWLYKLPRRSVSDSSSSGKGKQKETSVPEIDLEVSDDVLKKGTKYKTSATLEEELETLFDQARGAKEQMITPRFDPGYQSSSYVVPDEGIVASPGAYGAWLHWDPQLWLEYEQFVEIVTPVAMFSLSMPAEVTGTYAWLLPVEKREGDDASVSARMPKASIPPVTWIFALLLQSSTLPYVKRSTWYVETDRLQNVLGLRQRYIRAAIKDPTAVEQYGTY